MPEKNNLKNFSKPLDTRCTLCYACQVKANGTARAKEEKEMTTAERIRKRKKKRSQNKRRN